MALLEIQLPTKSNLYADVQGDATNLNILDRKSADAYEYLEALTGPILENDIGVPNADLADWADYRKMLYDLGEWFAGNFAGQQVSPRDVIDKFRRMR
jgi:hypothetical protein